MSPNFDLSLSKHPAGENEEQVNGRYTSLSWAAAFL